VEAEARAFAESVGAATDRFFAAAPTWRPGSTEDDRSTALSAALAELGWLDVAADPALLAIAGPAGFELGKRLAPVCELDALLEASPLAGGLVRYGARRAVTRAPDGLLAVEILRSEPAAYGDSLGVHRVLEQSASGHADSIRVAAWTAASTGYLAGLSAWALALALEHVKGRAAFGATLARLEPVQQRLADAATAATGLELLARASPGAAALAHAGAAAVEVTAACHQVCGAIGFTLEFRLHRASRRARALQLWTDALC
jgi:alkylation response protein AidB-like acyl-CoA dehydrogenase